jgi:hypothetical protein
MGLRDVINGMLAGPRGRRQPSEGRRSRLVPGIIWGLLGLLAYRHFTRDGERGVQQEPQDSIPPPRRWL